MAEKEEQYCLYNVKTRFYLKGFNRQAPLWVEKQSDAHSYPEMEALKLQRRLEQKYALVGYILLIEKK